MFREKAAPFEAEEECTTFWGLVFLCVFWWFWGLFWYFSFFGAFLLIFGWLFFMVFGFGGGGILWVHGHCCCYRIYSIMNKVVACSLLIVEIEP